MTCVIALEHQGRAYVGSDSFLGDEGFKDGTAHPKVMKKGSLLIAYAGSVRGAQIVEHGITFRRQKKGETPEAYMVNDVAARIKHFFDNLGAAVQAPGRSDSSESEFIVCVKGRVFAIQSDYGVIQSKHGFLSIGAGQPYASAAMLALIDLPPRERIKRSLEIAAELSPLVSAPFFFTEV